MILEPDALPRFLCLTTPDGGEAEMAIEKTATTLRLPQEKLRLIRAIAGYENRSLADIYEELTVEYIERHHETMELLGIPGFLDECREGIEEIKAGGGKEFSELDD
jgi:hypothetical protein